MRPLVEKPLKVCHPKRHIVPVTTGSGTHNCERTDCDRVSELDDVWCHGRTYYLQRPTDSIVSSCQYIRRQRCFKFLLNIYARVNGATAPARLSAQDALAARRRRVGPLFHHAPSPASREPIGI